MKKLILSIVCAGFASGMHAQTEDKKVQLGLAYQFGMNFNKPSTGLIERDGVGGHNALGINLNWNITTNVGLMLGAEFDFESFKYKVTAADPIYYRFIDKEIQKKENTEENMTAGTPSTLYNITNRRQKAIYGSIPVMLLFRTNAIGACRYYGKGGVRLSFLTGNTINDQGFRLTGDTLGGTKVALENEDMKVKSDMVFFRGSVGVAGGVQWNFTGSTVMFAELGFYYGFTPIHYGDALTGDDKERDMHLFQRKGTPVADDYLTFGAKQKQIVLKIGVLF